MKKVTAFSLDEKIITALKTEAQRRELTVSEVAKRALKKYLSRWYKL